MKDICKFAGTALLMLLALTLVGICFIPALTSDYDWLNILVATLYTLVVVLAAFYEGVQRGAQDKKFTALMEKQQQERGYQPTEAEAQRMYRAHKGLLAGLLSGSVGIVVALVVLFLSGEAAGWGQVAVRLILGAFIGLYNFLPDALFPWLYLPMALVFPLCITVGYLLGPAVWKKQVASMEKAKLEKKRKVMRQRRKARKSAQ